MGQTDTQAISIESTHMSCGLSSFSLPHHCPLYDLSTALSTHSINFWDTSDVWEDVSLQKNNGLIKAQKREERLGSIDAL